MNWSLRMLFALKQKYNIGLEVGLLDHTATLFLVFEGNSTLYILLSIMIAPIYIPTNRVGGFRKWILKRIKSVSLDYEKQHNW